VHKGHQRPSALRNSRHCGLRTAKAL